MHDARRQRVTHTKRLLMCYISCSICRIYVHHTHAYTHIHIHICIMQGGRGPRTRKGSKFVVYVAQNGRFGTPSGEPDVKVQAGEPCIRIWVFVHGWWLCCISPAMQIRIPAKVVEKLLQPYTHMDVCILVWLCMYVCMCMYLLTCMCVCVCVCVCICVYICVMYFAGNVAHEYDFTFCRETLRATYTYGWLYTCVVMYFCT